MNNVSYRRHPSPIGPLLVAATDAGICLVAFEEHERLERRLGDPGSGSQRYLEKAVCQLDEYFTGKRRSFTTPLDLSLASPFTRRVLNRLVVVPHGELITYGRLANELRTSARAVGRAVGSNPIPVIVPCHRVVASDGTLGGFGGGLDRKRALLKLEGKEELRGG